MIAIIDYGMGNLQSVRNSFEAIGAQAEICSDPARLQEADGIVLPGVGAFGDGMRNLRSSGFVEMLEEEVVRKEKPFLGLCLGMQLLATRSFEHGEHSGLGWIAGDVNRFAAVDPGARLRVPHIGWNDVRFAGPARIYQGMDKSSTFYFVHSYCFIPEDRAVVSGWCEYGVEFAASVETGNLFATQYHPEKSHKAGLAVLRNFLSLVGESTS